LHTCIKEIEPKAIRYYNDSMLKKYFNQKTSAKGQKEAMGLDTDAATATVWDSTAKNTLKN
jgi:hypothetical protein